ncbi:MAG TPA: glycosyltransferase family 4 protein [Actinomycetales bacterium]|nr:glycosyltransferase family 4 protein [Actinomycetales bacterium]
MKVWHLTWEYPPLVHGGLGRHVTDLVAAQRRLGLDVGVLTCRDDVTGTTTDLAAEHEVASRGDAGALEVLRAGLGRAWSDVVADAAAWQDELVRLAGPALEGVTDTWVLHAHDWMVADAARTLSRAHGVPWVLTVHATEHGRRQGRLDEPVHRAVHDAERRAARRADAVIVCSQAMRAEVTQVLGADPSSVVVVPGAVDAQAWAPGPAAASARPRWQPGSGPLVVAAGRLEWEKGFSTLVRAVPAVAAHHRGLRVVVAGAGSYRDTLDRLVDDLGLRAGAAAVELPGRLDQPRLAALLAAADVVVVPSRYEPFGLVALEAMAAGACVVSTRTGGLAETVADDVTGRVVEVGDVDGLASVLDQLLGDPTTRARLAAAGRRAALGRTWSAMAERTLAVYASVRPPG